MKVNKGKPKNQVVSGKTLLEKTKGREGNY